MSKTFKTFTPPDVKFIISKLPDNEQNTIIHFITKLLEKKSKFCGHCGKLLECSGPCDMQYRFYGCYGCGPVCYDCEKGDTHDLPCPGSGKKTIK